MQLGAKREGTAEDMVLSFGPRWLVFFSGNTSSVRDAPRSWRARQALGGFDVVNDDVGDDACNVAIALPGGRHVPPWRPPGGAM